MGEVGGRRISFSFGKTGSAEFVEFMGGCGPCCDCGCGKAVDPSLVIDCGGGNCDGGSGGGGDEADPLGDDS